jgi:hypothetical protein
MPLSRFRANWFGLAFVLVRVGKKVRNPMRAGRLGKVKPTHRRGNTL